MATDSTLVWPGILPPIISTRPNSPTVWAKPSTAPVKKPGRAWGTATVQKARRGEARSVAAADASDRPQAFKDAKRETARFYFERVLPRTLSHAKAIASGAASLMGRQFDIEGV